MKKLLKYLVDGETKERCGLILKGGRVIESQNLHPEPEKGFELDPEDLVKYEDTMVATWHTHPDHPSNLSQADDTGFKAWPNLKHYIIGVDGVSCFVVKDGMVFNED